MIRLVIALLLATSTAAGFVTEQSVDYIEIVGDGTLAIEDNEYPVHGITILAAEPMNLTCPVIVLEPEHVLAYRSANLTLMLNDANESISAPDTPGVSLHRCPTCTMYHAAPQDPCEVRECSLSIRAEPIQSNGISYRVIGDEPYTYWIEDAYGVIVRTPAQSSTSSAKSYTPPVGDAQRFFIIRAENACSSTSLIVGYLEEHEDTCPLPIIETEPITNRTISYRIIAEEPYTYWVENASAGTVREPAVSATAAIKTYTPPEQDGERIFTIHANTSCGTTTRAVGVYQPAEPEETCPLIIESDAKSTTSVSYRVIAEEPYTYWIEDGMGTIVREPSVSSTSTMKSYTPPSSIEHAAYLIYANTSCSEAVRVVAYTSPTASTETCAPPTIEAEPIQTERIRYRITSETPYAYSIEDMNEVLRSDTSTTDSVKQYTPKPSLPEQLYTIRAENECAQTNLTIGFLSDTDHCPEPDASVVCTDHQTRISELEGALNHCENPPAHMTSFYTLARTPSDAYTFRSSARSTATFLACSARETDRNNDTLTIRFDHDELANTPVLLAVESGTVVDARIASVPESIANALPDETSEEPHEPEEPQESEEPEEPSDEDSTAEPPVLTPPNPAEPLAANPVQRALMRIINLIRTNRTVQAAQPWVIPVGLGLSGLVLLTRAERL